MCLELLNVLLGAGKCPLGTPESVQNVEVKEKEEFTLEKVPEIYTADKKNTTETVWMWKHIVNEHEGGSDGVEFDLKVTGIYKKTIQRQLSEAQSIQKHRGESCLNSKTEYHGQRLKRIVIEGQEDKGSKDSRSTQKFTRKINNVDTEVEEPDKSEYKCESSLNTLKKNKEIKIHTDPVHVIDIPNFTCGKYSKSFKDMEELKTHELTHVNRQSYKCDNRSFKYAKDSELKPHIKKKHDDKENYSCVKCSEKFDGKDTLKIHKVTHIGQQTYVCDQRSHKYAIRTVS